MPRRISLLHSTALPRDESIAMDTRTDDFRGIGIDNTMPSITVAPHELRNIMSSSEQNDMTLREMMEDSTATGFVLKANAPWCDAYSKLHYDFLDSVQAHTSELQVFETIADFIRNCTDTLELMRGLL